MLRELPEKTSKKIRTERQETFVNSRAHISSTSAFKI